MLLQFMVENFRSFRDEVVLNMVPAKDKIHPEHVLKAEEKGRKTKALPLAVLYGANASGKSNLVQAMRFAKKLIVEGTRSDKPIGTVPFRLSPEAAGKPSRFEFVLKHEDVLYTYGFAVTDREVKEEWLFAVFQKQEVRLFERVTEDGKVQVEFGDKIAETHDEKQRLNFVAAGTRPNQLFLTEAGERNVEGIKGLISWFRHCLTIIGPDTNYWDLVQRAHRDERFVQFLSTFLRVADTGINGVNVRAANVGVGSDSSDGAVLSLKTMHKSSDGSDVPFETMDESDGTNRMINLALVLFDLQSTEKVYVIDDLNRSMHPLMCRLCVEAFLRGIKEEKSHGQIILTTHETCLLDFDLLRRDEIWFAEKDKLGSTHLTSLAEYEVRADLKVDKGYLNGRFGAIPFVGDIRDLLRKNADE